LRLSTAFHPQTDGQTERINQILEHYLRCFVGDEQITWPKLLKSAEFACNNAINATTGYSPFQALLGYSPDFRQRFEDEPSLREVPAAAARVEKLEKLRTKLKNHWRNAVESMTKHYNKDHKPLTLRKGSLVGLSTKNLKLKGSKKLTPRFIGPFRITETIGQQAYRLSLPKQYSRIHNVFHVSLLEPWRKSHSIDAESMPMPQLEDEEEYEVEEVRDERKISGETHYLVKWKGWPSEYNQWVPQKDMANATETIQAYRRQQNRGNSPITTKEQRKPLETETKTRRSSRRKRS
jgi:hypothetical protein